jgi:hypothetical protein
MAGFILVLAFVVLRIGLSAIPGFSQKSAEVYEMVGDIP